MSSDRSKLKLDEQSFETLLAAAYTVQEHNAKQKLASNGQACVQCGAALDPEHQFCGRCGTRRDELRPGERLQRNWASLWTMSQKEGTVPHFTSVKPTLEEPAATTLDSEVESSDPVWADDSSSSGTEQMEAGADNTDLHSLLLPSGVDPSGAGEATTAADPEASRPWNLRLVLKFHRGDLYLALAILVSALAIGWAIWGTPLTSGTAAGSQLSVGERTLVKLGIAEAPDRPVTYHGNPKARVWADPHTALYYCDGDEDFGKTRGGHYTTQKEAQMDRFSPAARTPCR
jgi:ribosomal protein L40E